MGGRTIIEPAREVDVIHETGVLVVGSGPSGLAAALAAAGAVDGVRADPQTYADWSSGEWAVQTTGKEGELFSPFLRTPFQRAAREGVIEAELQTLAGTWGAVHDSGELTYLNVVHLAACDGTDPDSLTRFEIEGRRQAAAAIDAMRRYTPGCAGARLRNFGMTIGIRDTRKLDAVYNLTEADVRGEARFEDSIGIYPEFIDGYGVLVLPTTGRYMQIPYRSMLPRGVRRLLVAGRAIGGDRIAHAATRNMACCVVTGQAAGIAAAVSLASDRELDELEFRPVSVELERQGVRRL